jgi:hypothetical protein
MSVLDLLTRAQNLIRDPNNWTQDFIARDKIGRPVNVTDPDAVCFCSLGALARAEPDPEARAKAKIYLHDAVDHLTGGWGIATFNDREGRTHEEVMAMWDKARELAS